MLAFNSLARFRASGSAILFLSFLTVVSCSDESHDDRIENNSAEQTQPGSEALSSESKETAEETEEISVPTPELNDPVQKIEERSEGPTAPPTDFDLVIEQLETRGDSFSYHHVESEINWTLAQFSKLIEHWQNNLEAFPDISAEAYNVGMLTVASETVKQLGIVSVGKSSSFREESSMFHNRQFIHVPEETNGSLPRFLGGEPSVFRSIDLAPVDADFIFEIELGTERIVRILNELFETISEPQGKEFVDTLLAYEVPGLAGVLDWAGLAKKGDLRISVIGKLNRYRTLTPTNGNSDFDIPHLEILIAVDSLDWTYDLAKPMWEKAGFGTSIAGTSDRLLSKEEVLMFDYEGGYRPVIQVDREGKRLFLASSAEFLDSCLEAKGEIRGLRSFKDANHNLSDHGNCYSYHSSNFSEQVRNFLVRLMEGNDYALAERETSELEILLAAWLGKSDAERAFAITTLPNGILAAGNSPHSFSHGQLFGGLSGAAQSSFLLNLYEEFGNEQLLETTMVKASYLMEAIDAFRAENNDQYPADLELLTPDFLSNRLPLQFTNSRDEVSNWIYYPSDESSSLLFAAPDYLDGNLIVGLKDGTVRVITPENIRFLLMNTNL